MTKLRYGKGRGSIEIIGPQKEIAMALLNEAEPMIVKVLKQELATREAFARRGWPKRQKRYGKSNNSRKKFEKTIRIVPPNGIEAAFSNKAEYAWAIIAGKDSKTTVKAGKRVADVLMWQPAKKSAKMLTEKLATAVLNPVKKVR